MVFKTSQLAFQVIKLVTGFQRIVTLFVIHLEDKSSTRSFFNKIINDSFACNSVPREESAPSSSACFLWWTSSGPHQIAHLSLSAQTATIENLFTCVPLFIQVVHPLLWRQTVYVTVFNSSATRAARFYLQGSIKRVLYFFVQTLVWLTMPGILTCAQMAYAISTERESTLLKTHTNVR